MEILLRTDWSVSVKRVKRRRLLFCVLAGILLCLSAVSFCMAKSGKADGGNELLVTFKTGVTKRQAKKTMEKMELAITEEMFQKGETMLRVRLNPSGSRKDVMEQLQKSPEVAAVQLNYRYSTKKSSDSGDPFADRQWNLDYMDVPEAWKLIDKIRPKSKRSQKDKVIVATLDTGINYRHPDLEKNIDVRNCVTVAGKEPPYPVYDKVPSSHGTGTAGILAATSNNSIGIAGVASGNHNDLISLMGINVFRSEDYSCQANASTADIIKGLEYACEKGAKVINMCLGHSAGDVDLLGTPHDDAALEKAINDAVYKKDVVVVCSAGNKGDSRPWYPSDFDAAISVINTGKYRNAWSRSCKSPHSSFGRAKDLSAPGSEIYTTSLRGAYKKGSGTSLAAPSVAGVAALVRYVNPGLSAVEVKEILYSTATDLYKPGYDIYTGYGNVNACRAVAAAAGVDDGLKEPRLPRPKSVKARSAGAHSIRISWKKVPRANGYYIYRCSRKKGTYKRVKKTTGSRILSFRDTGRKFNKPFYYKVMAYGTTRDGKKALSPESKIVSSRSCCEVPIVKGLNRDYQTIRLSWKKASGADGYQVFRSGSGRGKYHLVETVSSSRSRGWTDSGLSPGRTYHYKVRAYRTHQKKKYCSEWSEPLRLKATPAKPVFSLKKKGRKAILKWKSRDSSKISGYQIYRRTENRKWRLMQTARIGKRTYVDRNLKPGRKYAYRIRTYKDTHGKRIYSKSSKVKSKKI